jgi:murein DD-endopeptidase MepM/ murein hydrolase activator NlpD
MIFGRYVTTTVSVIGAVIALWIGSSLFTYFTYNVTPEIRVTGVESEKSYKGGVKCFLNARNGYKIAAASLSIDGMPLDIEAVKSIRAKEFDIPFEIDTKNLSDGKHILKIEATDSSYHANKSNDQIEFFVDNKPLQVAFLQPDYSVLQGRTLHPKIRVNKPGVMAKIKLFANEYECYPDSNGSTVYESFIPIDCEQNADDYVMNVEVVDKVGNVVSQVGAVKIKRVNFPKQKGFTVSQEKLDEEKEVSMNNKILKVALEKWLEKSPRKKLWSGPFEVPTVVRRITTPFGEIRITPERGRYHHRAIDIANTPRSVVWASQNGRVIIKDRYLMSGNTVVIDHGLGVFTKYYHLDDFSDVEVGDTVRKGAPLGKLGMTGYANGYHLHWELSINGVSIDPLEWTKSVF